MKTSQTQPIQSSKFSVRSWMLIVFLPLSLLFAVSAGAATRYVWQDSPNPTPPYTNWASSATNIQDAVDAADAGDTVLVTNGVYATGGRAIHGAITNRVAVDKPLTLLSVNGPGATIIQGFRDTAPPYDAVRCVYLTNGATLSGFTLTNGGTLSSGDVVLEQSGAGVWCESTDAVITNCWLLNNSARSSLDPNTGYGGGAYRGTLVRCELRGNSAHDGAGAHRSILSSCLLVNNSTRHPNGLFGRGGGASLSTLSGCTLAGNTAGAGGGARGGTLNNCIAYYNFATTGTNYDLATLNHTCTTPLPAGGVGNITDAPLFLDTNDWANPRLQSGSPCIDAGDNALVTTTADLDGNPRIQGGTVDMGAYEFQASAGIRYVNVNNPNPSAPYTSWDTAATNIQDAVDAANPGETVLVTNGVYATGGKVVDGETNRVAVDKPLILTSVNGPEATQIVGSRNPNSMQGIRCVYLINGASLSGFTCTNGATRTNGGGVLCESTAAVISNCVLVGNRAWESGGGAYGGTLEECLITSNSSPSGGGASESALYDCVVSNNSGEEDPRLDSVGGGILGSTAYNCTLTGNSAQSGGGASRSELSNCTLSGNWATDLLGEDFGRGGGVGYSTLNNCVLTGNSANFGGGAYTSTLNNCTLVGNLSESPTSWPNGAVVGGTLSNCIVYHNKGEGNYSSGSVMNYTCTTPIPTNGVGNIDLDPQLATAWRLSSSSPCIGAGNSAYATGTDIDGEPWANPPSMGCDEYWAGSVTGLLSVAISASATEVTVCEGADFVAEITGRASASVWDFGDGTVVSNQPFTSHVWATPGDYEVVLTAYNESFPGGISATTQVQVLSVQTHYVWADNSNPVPPYTSWATAATNIQDAVDVACPGDTVLVTNGVYASDQSRAVRVGKPMNLLSVNGPEGTIIDGLGVVRCVFLVDGATLSGFTLTNGSGLIGGGVLGQSTNALVTNCLLTSNSASAGGGASRCTLNNCVLTGNSALSGGGASLSTLNNCTLTDNAATGSSSSLGGGASSSTLNNCTLTGNSAIAGGGANSGTLNNCTLSGNSASLYGGGSYDGTLNNCTIVANSAGERGGGASGSTLNNCTLTDNSAAIFGGGSYFGTLNNCALTGNYAESGGGACDSTLNNCTLTGNSATAGGGSTGGTLNNCTLTGNSAMLGGGTGGGGSELNNCIVYNNTAPDYPNYSFGSTLNYTCTTPLPTNGVGNIDLDPLFVDTNDWADLRLLANSPCINAGNNDYVTWGTDLDGNPRIVGGTVDMGAYEFQLTNSAPIADASATPTLVVFAGGACRPKHGEKLPPSRHDEDRWNLDDRRHSLATLHFSRDGVGDRRTEKGDGRMDDADGGDRREGRWPEPYRFSSILATVVLDGSRSFDPDGDSLIYLWQSSIRNLPSTTIATGVVATVLLPAGVHAIDLVVDDGQLQDTNTVTVTVLTAEQAVQRLIRLVNALDLRRKQPLLAGLEAALDSIQRGNCQSAVGQLRAFQHKVRAQVSDPALARGLIHSADLIVAALGGDGSPPVVGQVRSLKRKPDGRMHLEFNGAAGAAYILEASTNMVDWKAICVVHPGDDGRCEFEDADAARFPSRFYRVVEP